MQNKRNECNIPGYTDFEFDFLAKAIIESQNVAQQIRKEYKKLAAFYKRNPDLLFESLYSSKEELEQKPNLDEFEQMSLNEINNLLDKEVSVEEMFKFQEDFLLDDYSKVFSQIARKDPYYVLTSPTVDIIYYALQIPIENIPIGEFFSNGNVNTGSQIVLKVIKVDPRIVVNNYQTLFN